MNPNIEVGDLVLCIRPPECCGSLEPLGGPYLVVDVRLHGTPGICVWCRKKSGAQMTPEAQLETANSGLGWIETKRLKKIPPLTDDEIRRESVELHVLKRIGEKRKQGDKIKLPKKLPA